MPWDTTVVREVRSCGAYSSHVRVGATRARIAFLHVKWFGSSDGRICAVGGIDDRPDSTDGKYTRGKASTGMRC